MADASNPFDARRRRPRDWGEAFADLPLETPPLSVWSQIEARLNASSTAAAEASADAVVLRMPSDESSPQPQSARRKLSSRAWLALAASVSALALLPLLWSNLRETSDTTSAPLAGASLREAASEQAAPTPNTRTVADATPATQPVRSPRSATNAPAGTTRIATTSATAARDARIEDRTSSAESASPSPLVSVASTRPAPTLTPVRTPTPAMGDSSQPRPSEVASADKSQVEALPQNAVLIGEADADATDREMELLYAASAQLETLLAYTRDPRVETGPAAALSSEIHTRLAKIDARLAQPGLSADEQYALWQARVGTLRQAVAVESELHDLSAEDQGYAGKAVEIY